VVALPRRDDRPRRVGVCRELYERRRWRRTFLAHGVGPTNGAGERALRQAVIWRKLFVGTRSAGGSRFVETGLVFPPKANAADERLARHLCAHRDDLLTLLRQPGLDAANWRAELAIRFGVILRKVWGDSRTWPGARAQSVLMPVWRTCWYQGRTSPGTATGQSSSRVNGGPENSLLPPTRGDRLLPSAAPHGPRCVGGPLPPAETRPRAPRRRA
jgi:hypothetical protein